MAESFLGIPKPLSDYGKRGEDVASAFSSGSLGYHLEQLSMDDRNLLKRNNNFDFDAFLKREGGNSTVKAIKSILEKTGDNIQKGKIPPAAIIDHLTKVDLKINDKTEPISKDLAWGILRWSNYLAESKRKNNNFKIATGVVLTATLAGGALIAHHKNGTPESSQTKPTQAEQVVLPTNTPEMSPTLTVTTTPDFTPESTPTPNPEQQIATEWHNILTNHAKDSLGLNGGVVIANENLNDPDGFRNEVSSFMDEYDMFHGTKQVIHHGGKPDETDLSIEMSADSLTMVRIDGRHAMSTDANAFAYDPKTGACMAMNIDIDGNRTLLNSTPAGSDGPKDCIAMAYTSAGARIVVEFQPSGSDVLVRGAIFQADIK